MTLAVTQLEANLADARALRVKASVPRPFGSTEIVAFAGETDSPLPAGAEICTRAC